MLLFYQCARTGGWGDGNLHTDAILIIRSNSQNNNNGNNNNIKIECVHLLHLHPLTSSVTCRYAMPTSNHHCHNDKQNGY